MDNFIDDIEIKQCSVCQECKPGTKEYFRPQINPNYPFRHRCKCCDKLINTNNLVLLINAPCPEGSKQCTQCRKIKPADTNHFHPHKNGKNGLYAQCRECTRKISTIYRNNNIERSIQGVAQYRKQFPEKVNKANRDYEARHPEKKKLWRDKWINANREKMRQWGRLKEIQRRARKKTLPDNFTQEDYDKCMEYWGHSCAITQSKDKVCLDHWIPLASSDCPGTIPTNIIPLSFKLNCSKKNRNPEEWLKWKFGEQRGAEILASIEAYFQWLAELPDGVAPEPYPEHVPFPGEQPLNPDECGENAPYG